MIKKSSKYSYILSQSKILQNGNNSLKTQRKRSMTFKQHTSRQAVALVAQPLIFLMFFSFLNSNNAFQPRQDVGSTKIGQVQRQDQPKLLHDLKHTRFNFRAFLDQLDMIHLINGQVSDQPANPLKYLYNPFIKQLVSTRVIPTNPPTHFFVSFSFYSFLFIFLIF